jgi:Uma2 family endonuclease
MITSRKGKTLLTPEQYLEIERNADYKSQYFDGEMFAMSGASRAHNLISTNVTAILRPQLRKRRCEIYAGDMRVCVSSTGLYTYPDLIVVCGQPQFLGGGVDTLLNPTLLKCYHLRRSSMTAAGSPITIARWNRCVNIC